MDIYLKHVQEEHQSGHFCRECDKTVTEKDFFPHLWSHKKGPFDCIYCEFGARDGKTIKRHVIDEHPNELPYICVRFVRDLNIEHSAIESMSVFPVVNEETLEPGVVKQIPKDVFVELIDAESKSNQLKISFVQGGVNMDEIDTQVSVIEKTIENLPKKYFFDNDMVCDFCPYKTKIRVNFVRHLQFHKSGNEEDRSSKDPVNRINPIEDGTASPVKSPEKQKKSRMSTVAKKREKGVLTLEDFRKAPKFVQGSSRWICGATDCPYTAINEKIFEIHLETLHADDNEFQCPHCDFLVDRGPIDIDEIFKHYKMHGDQLYKCRQCQFMAPTQELIGKHIHRKHSLSIAEDDVLKVRDKDSEFVETPSPVVIPPKPTKKRRMSVAVEMEVEQEEKVVIPVPVRKRRSSVSTPKTQSHECQYCEYKTGDFEMMRDHVFDKHNFKTQYECGICQAGMLSVRGTKLHFHYKHKSPKEKLSIVSHFISVDTEEGDEDGSTTVSYWRRDSTSKAKTIRGIQCEEDDDDKEEDTDNDEEEEKEDNQEKEDEEGNEVDEEEADTQTDEINKMTELFTKKYNIKLAHGSITFNCELCPDYRVDSLGDIQMHYQNSHPANAFNPKLPSFLTFSCYFCSFKNSSPNLLIQHFTIYHDNLPCLFRVDKLLKCLYCKFTDSAEVIQSHFETAHPKKKLTISTIKCATACGLCDFVYEFQAELRDHFAKAHSSAIVNPPIKYSQPLLRRLSNIKVNKVYKCNECAEILNEYQYRFHNHQSKCIPIEMPYQYLCSICPELFLDVGQAARHMEDHKQEEITCEKCNKVFCGLDVVMVHLTEEHRQVKVYKDQLTKQYTLEVILPNGLILPKTQTVNVLLKADKTIKRKPDTSKEATTTKKAKVDASLKTCFVNLELPAATKPKKCRKS